MAEEKTKKYKLIARQHSGAPDKSGVRQEYTTGDMVPLTDRQYEKISDKFAPYDADKDKEIVVPGAPGVPQGTKPDTVEEGKETKPSDGAKGAGAAANSANTKTVA